MDCKKIRELIITDYSDKELGEKSTREVHAHLTACMACRAFEESLRKAAIEPFKNVKEIRPPEYIWERIKEAIRKENSRQDEWVFSRAKDYLQAAFSSRRRVFSVITAAAACIALLVISGRFLSSQAGITDYLREQEEFLTSLDPDDGNSSAASHGGLDTTIEEYFG